MIAHGKLVDPTGLMPAIKKHDKAADWASGMDKEGFRGKAQRA
jgi:hypothetical protein